MKRLIHATLVVASLSALPMASLTGATLPNGDADQPSAQPGQHEPQIVVSTFYDPEARGGTCFLTRVGSPNQTYSEFAPPWPARLPDACG
jgi:hypothetical protein